MDIVKFARQFPSLVLAAGFLTTVPVAAYAQSEAEILNYTGEDREEFLMAGAEEEGELVIYSAMIVDQALEPLSQAFMEKYPFVEVSYWRGDSEDIAQRVLAETRANNLVVDVIEGTSVGATLVQAGVAAPFTTPMLDAYEDIYKDPEGLWVPTRLSYYCAAYNTDLVSPEEVPTTFEGLLDERWRDQIAWRIGSESGTPLFITNVREAWGEEEAEAYLQDLSEQNVVNFGAGSARTLVDRVVAGEYQIAVNIFCHHPLISAEQGAPVASQPMDPMATTAATLLIPQGVRHPYAASLFTDFLLSEEGQEIMAGADYFPAHPDVPPSDVLSSIVPANAGVESNFVSPAALVDEGVRSDELYQQYFR